MHFNLTTSVFYVSDSIFFSFSSVPLKQTVRSKYTPISSDLVYFSLFGFMSVLGYGDAPFLPSNGSTSASDIFIKM